MVGDSTHPKALAIQLARCTREISVKIGKNIIVDERSTVVCAEDDMHQVEAQRLWHRTIICRAFSPLRC